MDLYLIHWPGAQGVSESSPENAAKRIDTWKKLIELHAGGQGVLKAIGVSNYLPRHLEETVTSTGVPPAINQVFTVTYKFNSYKRPVSEICCGLIFILFYFQSKEHISNLILC